MNAYNAPYAGSDSKTRYISILYTTVPIFIGMSSSMLTSFVDTAISSRMNVSSIAAVGICSFVFFFLFSFANGFSTAIQRATVVEHAKDRETSGTSSLITGILLSVIVSIILCCFSFLNLNDFFNIIAPDSETAALCAEYMKPLIYSLPFFYLNTSFRGYLNASNRSGIYMRNNLIIQIVNVAAAVPLAFGYLGLPELGIAGIGYGTMIAYIAGTASYVISLVAIHRESRLRLAKPRADQSASLVKSALIAGAGLNLYALGWVISFWIVGRLGTDSVAVYQIIAQLTLFPIYVANSFGATAVNLVGVAIEGGFSRKAYSDGIRVSLMAGLITTIYCLLVAFFSKEILTYTTQGRISEYSYLLTIFLSLVILPLYTIGVVATNVIQGCNLFLRAFLVTSSTQWLLFLPLAWFFTESIGLGLLGVVLAEFIYRSAVVFMHGSYWLRSGVFRSSAI